MMARKILIIVGDGGESYETLYANHRFMEDGFVPVVAAPSKRALNLVIHDFEPGWDTYVEKPGYKWSSDITFDEVNVADYEGVVVIGGRSPEYLRNDERVLNILREFDKAGKGVFPICHGVQIAAAAGLAKGKRVTCYEHVRWEAIAAGGKYEDREVVRDGNLISARTWQDHPGFYREVMGWLREHAPKQAAKLSTVGAAA
jgi:protease I